MSRGEMVCTNCGSLVSPQSKTPGSFWIELLLWLFFIVPGVIYSVWRLSSVRKECPKCGGRNLVPSDTPVGMRLLGIQTSRPQTPTSTPQTDFRTILRALVSSWAFWLTLAILVALAIAPLCHALRGR